MAGSFSSVRIFLPPRLDAHEAQTRLAISFSYSIAAMPVVNWNWYPAPKSRCTEASMKH